MPLGTRSKLVHISAGPIESPKNELINLVFEFSRNIQIYTEYEGLHIDILHSHYWLSGLVGDLLSESWEIPLVITFHTLAKTKSRALPVGDEHTSRSASEYKLMCRSDKILVLTQKELQDMTSCTDHLATRLLLFHLVWIWKCFTKLIRMRQGIN